MSATLQLLGSKKAQLEQELKHLEKQASLGLLTIPIHGTDALFSDCNKFVQLYEKEGHYLGAEHSQHGTVVKVNFAMSSARQASGR